MESFEIRYEIDAQDRISAVNPSWDNFAQVNGGQRLQAQEVTSRSLWDYIFDSDTKELHQEMVAWVRSRQQAFVYDYRCDSPECRRFMNMHITPSADNGLVFTSRVMRVEARDPKYYARVVAMNVRPTVFRCSMCNRFHVEKNWCELETLFQKGLHVGELPVQVGYTVCSECVTQIRSRIKVADKH